MSRNTATVLIMFIGATFGGAALMTDNLKTIKRENNAFAKDCNDRGGFAEFGPGARQCIGARPAAPHDTLKGENQ